MKILMIDKDKDEMNRIAKIIKRSMENVEVHILEADAKISLAYFRENTSDVVVLGQGNQKGTRGEWLEQIRSYSPNSYVIVYAKDNRVVDLKKDLESKVYRYILGPINKRNFIPILYDICEQLERERQAMELSDKCSIMLNQGKEALEFSFIYYALFDISTKEKLRYFTQMFNVRNTGYAMVIRCEESAEAQALPYEQYCQVINDLAPYGYRCIIGPKMVRRIIVLVMEVKENSLDDKSRKLQQIKYATAIRKNLKDDLKINVEVGIGSEREVNALNISYEEALRSMRYEKENVISHVQDIELGKRMKRQHYMELEAKLLACVRNGESEVFTILDSLLHILDDYRLEDKKNKIVELLVLTAHEIRLKGPSTTDFISYMEMIKEINGVGISELNAWVYRYFNFIVNCIRECQEEQSLGLIDKTLKYMEEHFAQDLSLQEMSRLANVSPQYFSRLFREKMDMTFVDYLTKLRINKAVEWLKYSNKNIQEICYGVGYKDPNYFSRVFKKNTGHSPKEYMQNRIK